jgi:hypothetical protein
VRERYMPPTRRENETERQLNVRRHESGKRQFEKLMIKSKRTNSIKQLDVRKTQNRNTGAFLLNNNMEIGKNQVKKWVQKGWAEQEEAT